MTKRIDTTYITVRLSCLWLFALLNYLYCDVLTLMDPELLNGFIKGNVGGIHMTQGFLLGAAVLMEIPIAMTLLSRILAQSVNRWANIASGTIMTGVQLSTLFFGSTPTMYYIFFSLIEVVSTSLIVWLAWNWRTPKESILPNQAL